MVNQSMVLISYLKSIKSIKNIQLDKVRENKTEEDDERKDSHSIDRSITLHRR